MEERRGRELAKVLGTRSKERQGQGVVKRESVSWCAGSGRRPSRRPASDRPAASGPGNERSRYRRA